MTRPSDELGAILVDLLSDGVRRAILEVVPGVVRQAVDDAVSRLTANPPDTTVMVSIAETAKRLGLGVTTTKNLATTGQIRSVMVERRRLIPVEAIHDYVRRLEEESARLRVLPERRSSRRIGT
jgi:excisionase family DNA binding protein